MLYLPIQEEIHCYVCEQRTVLKSWALRRIKSENASVQNHLIDFKSWRRSEIQDLKHITNSCLQGKYKKKAKRIFSSSSVEINCEKYNQYYMLK